MKKIFLTLIFLTSVTSCSEVKKDNNPIDNKMKKALNLNNDQVTVLVEVSYSSDLEVIKKFIRDEQAPLFFNLDDPGIIRFEWFLNEAEKTGTLIEVFENSNVWEELGNKVLGSPINIKFRELFKIEKLTVLGDINENFKAKIQAMNPVIKSYVGGIN
ncbi:MAG: hypothetical protein CMC41_05590 [Flavobacteriaceae bacterium]|nr:hypothetical protein [Flavobacteriaceae bacterium]|tara:strand:+ start:1236 stop:1709 length:474 start_codon:yes stop_codon:yes gene_type:complete